MPLPHEMSFCPCAGSAPSTKPSASCRTWSPSMTWLAMRWSPRRRATTRSLGLWSVSTWEIHYIKSALWSSRYFFLSPPQMIKAVLGVNATTLCFIGFRTLWRTAKPRSKPSLPSCWRTCRTPSGPLRNKPLPLTHPHPSAVQTCRFKWPVF